MKIFHKKWFWFLAILALLLVAFNVFVTLRKSDKQVKRFFAKKGQTVVIKYFKTGGQPVRYISAQEHNSDLPLVFFVHGAPGSSEDFYDYLADSSLYHKANLVAVDRLGYGYSDYGNAETSIERQASVINELLQDIPSKNVLVVGWSFGGPIAAKMAMQNAKIDALLMLAPAVDPSYEKIFSIGMLAKWKATRWFVPKPFRMAEEEKLTHISELTKLENEWAGLQIPIVHMHGNEDNLVPFENLAFAQEHIPASYFTPIVVEKGGHLLPWKNYDLVKNQILTMIKDIQP